MLIIKNKHNPPASAINIEYQIFTGLTPNITLIKDEYREFFVFLSISPHKIANIIKVCFS